MTSPLGRRLAALLLTCLLAVGLAACGSSDKKSSSSDKASTTPKAPRYGKVFVQFETPPASQQLAATVLDKGGMKPISEALGKQFKLPNDIHVIIHDGDDGPFYDPSTRSINLFYGFADFTGGLIKKNNPQISDTELGTEWAATNAFLLIHEWAHLLIDQFKIPVTGKEEDAADALAAVMLTKFVKKGDEYSFDAAEFFNNLSARQLTPTQADYFDEHSLDKQRAYEIVCWIAGSSQQDFQIIQSKQILSDERLQRCPSEYQQKVNSWLTLLKPHFRKQAAA